MCWFTLRTDEDTRPAVTHSSPSTRKSETRLSLPVPKDYSPTPVLQELQGASADGSLPKDSAKSFHPVERVVAQGTVLDERIARVPDGGWQRIRLVKASIQPRPLRVEEEWRLERGAWVCLRRDMYLADQLILKIQPGFLSPSWQNQLRAAGVDSVVQVAPDTFTARLHAATLDSAPKALATILADVRGIESAEMDGVGFSAGAPNDTHFATQWALQNTGQSGGTAGADIGAMDLWDILLTAPGVVIAHLDTGLNLTHPDLVGVTWINPGEIAGDGIDNDGDGFIDDVNGWDFTNSDNDPTDDHGHGSNVGGIIVANRNNSLGMAGVLSGVKLMVCKVVDANNVGTTSALISGVTYARQRGVPIMNLSLQNYPSSTTLSNEFNACQTAGILLCICAGNQGLNNDVIRNYPSSYPQTNIIAVGNHDRTDVRWTGSPNPSNYGATNVDLYAPGREVLGPILGTDYSYYTGTSQATPFVSAVAAAIKYVNPTWKSAEIKAAIMNSVVTNANYTGKSISGGRLNALTSLSYAIRQETTNDADGDHVGNLFEYLAGTRLDDATSKPVITSNLENGYLHLKMLRITRTDAHFEVQKTVDFSTWTAVGVTDFSTTSWLDGGISVSGNSLGFLRVKAVASP